MIDVAIIGAGPVGTLLAAEAARHGVTAVGFERRAEAGAGSRAVGVHATALAAMEASGATERVLATALRVRVGEARRGATSLGEVRFDRLRTRHPYVATLPQSATEAALTATAAAWGAPSPRRGGAVRALVPRGDAVEVHVGHGDDVEVVVARVVVVAGGLRARSLVPMPARVRRYPDRYLMTDCADASDEGSRAIVHLDRDGVLESFPLPGDRRRYVAWMRTPADGGPAEASSDADAERLRAAVARRSGSEAAAGAVEWATSFGVARSRLTALRAGRILAIGDTAHEVSPIGGQGMNLGLIDAVTLAPLLGRWLREGEPPAALDRWESERLRAAARAGRIAAINTTLGRPARTAGAAAVRVALHSPAARLLAHAYAMGFDPAAGRFRAPR